jgi:hypothetical protein
MFLFWGGSLVPAWWSYALHVLLAASSDTLVEPRTLAWYPSHKHFFLCPPCVFPLLIPPMMCSNIVKPSTTISLVLPIFLVEEQLNVFWEPSLGRQGCCLPLWTLVLLSYMPCPSSTCGGAPLLNKYVAHITCCVLHHCLHSSLILVLLIPPIATRLHPATQWGHNWPSPIIYSNFWHEWRNFILFFIWHARRLVCVLFELGLLLPVTKGVVTDVLVKLLPHSTILYTSPNNFDIIFRAFFLSMMDVHLFLHWVSAAMPTSLQRELQCRL